MLRLVTQTSKKSPSGKPTEQLAIMVKGGEIFSEYPKNFTDIYVNHDIIAKHFGYNPKDIIDIGWIHTDNTEVWLSDYRF